MNNRLRRISEVVGSGQGDIKKGLKIDFVGEEGVDAGGLRKEWFLLLIREVFDETHGEHHHIGLLPPLLKLCRAFCLRRGFTILLLQPPLF